MAPRAPGRPRTNCQLSQACSSVTHSARQIAHEFGAAAGGPSAPSQQGSIRQYSMDQPRIEQGDICHIRTGVIVPTVIRRRAELGELPAFFG